MSPYVPDAVLAIVVAVMVGAGLYLMLERSLTRIALGVVMLGNGVNLLFLLVGGPPGGPPLVGITDPQDMSDPLPQAFVLTAIVITLAIAAFLVALAYRSWQLYEHDEVQDDFEDRRLARVLALHLEDGEDLPMILDEEALEARDETASFTDEHWVADTVDDHG